MSSVLSLVVDYSLWQCPPFALFLLLLENIFNILLDWQIYVYFHNAPDILFWRNVIKHKPGTSLH